MDLEISQILSQIIAFLVMVWVLGKFGWKPLLKHLDERKEKIKAEFQEIENEKEKVQTLIFDYKEKMSSLEENARYRLQEVIAEGQAIADEIKAKAQESIKEAQIKIQANIQLEIAKAQELLKIRLVEIVMTTTERALQATLHESDHKKIMEEFVVKELEGMKIK